MWNRLHRTGLLCAAGLLVLASGPLFAAPPSYKEVQEKLAVLWKERYPVALTRSLPDPEKRGILSAVQDGKQVLYYHFSVVVQRPVRNADGTMGSTGERKIELWVRYRAWETSKFDMSFVRMDRLPGADKRWIKQ
ncbi:MAG: hypothetical protein HY042_03675 [Spirochaetia bacterium]|nr:hypothetical protein [Spirochaetia bacterium]